MIKELWLDYGSTGQYSDFTEWVVCACLEEEKAKRITEELNNWCREKGFSHEGNYDSDEVPELDPNFRSDYTGTGYAYYKVQVR